MHRKDNLAILAGIIALVFLVWDGGHHSGKLLIAGVLGVWSLNTLMKGARDVS